MIDRAGATPTHVACIMDGNGRWATSRGLDRIHGHQAGEEAILSAIDAAVDCPGLDWLTLFAFSTENWNRPEEEVAFLMGFNQRVIDTHGPDFHRRGIRVRYMGQASDRVPRELRRSMAGIQSLTSGNRGLTLTFAFDYGGRAELTAAVRQIILDGVAPSDVSESTVSDRLWFPDMPEPDLIVRTAGECRLSNFLLWQAAYAELLFVDVLWPDFRASDLDAAVAAYAERQRSYGGVSGR